MKKRVFIVALLATFATANTVSIQDMKWTEDFETLVNLSSQAENSLAGIDQNNNGVRDDVEYFIDQKFSNKPFQKAMFTQAAQTMQKIITLPKVGHIKEHQKLDHDLLMLYTCRDYILYKFEDTQIEKEMQAKIAFKGKVLNTSKRLHAYIDHKKVLPYHFDELSDHELEKEKIACVKQYNKYQKSETKRISLAK